MRGVFNFDVPKPDLEILAKNLGLKILPVTIEDRMRYWVRVPLEGGKMIVYTYEMMEDCYYSGQPLPHEQQGIEMRHTKFIGENN